jgi:hypothetical protein
MTHIAQVPEILRRWLVSAERDCPRSVPGIRRLIEVAEEESEKEACSLPAWSLCAEGRILEMFNERSSGAMSARGVLARVMEEEFSRAAVAPFVDGPRCVTDSR